jgi:hypothetical protein
MNGWHYLLEEEERLFIVQGKKLAVWEIVAAQTGSKFRGADPPTDLVFQCTRLGWFRIGMSTPSPFQSGAR